MITPVSSPFEVAELTMAALLGEDDETNLPSAK